MWSLAVVSFVLAYITVVLIGSHECFQGTFVERWHYNLTDGICDGLEYLIDKTCGNRGLVFLQATEAACCRGSNPIGQVFFLFLFCGCFAGIVMDVFPLMDETLSWHKYSGTAVALLVLYLFIKVINSDPGIINESNLAAHLLLYSPDGILFTRPPLVCRTCKQKKPARSKHCNATKACVARFDHWCIWINNAIGLYNTRLFLAFLVATSAACLYGAVISSKVIAADMRRNKAWDTQWKHPKSGITVKLGDKWGLVVQFVLARYPVAAAIAAFLAVVFWIVLGFTALQLYRIAIGVTTNESWKIKEAKAEGVVLDDSAVPLEKRYTRGWRRNLAEILFPYYYLNAENVKEK